MSLDVSDIIKISTSIKAGGIGNANFGAAAFFPTLAEVDAALLNGGTFEKGTFKTYNDAGDLLTDGFLSSDDTYIAVNKWLGGIPSGDSIIVYFNDQNLDAAGTTQMLTDARNVFWWYWGFFGTPYYDITGESQVSVSDLTVLTLVATATIPDSSSLEIGDIVPIAGATPAGLNGNQTVKQAPTGTTFTFDTAEADQTATGTITADLPNGAVDETVVDAIVAHADAKDSWMFINCAYDREEVKAIRDENVTTDICSKLTLSGPRHAATVSSLTDAYAGLALAKWYANVNYNALNTTLTGDFKVLSGVTAESLPNAEYTAMQQQTKKCCFYTVVDLQGQTDSGRVRNSWSHSAFGEWIDDIVNLDAFVNSLKVELYNITANQPTKLGQDPIGQAMLLGGAKDIGQQYIDNDYLGPRNYVDPDDGIEKYTEGYEILSKAEDILDISDSERTGRESAPVRIRIFRKGAIHFADVSVDVF